MLKLNFNIPKCKCDFCDKKKKVARTTYGTTHYIRLICKDCAIYINKYHKCIDGKEMFIFEKED